MLQFNHPEHHTRNFTFSPYSTFDDRYSSKIKTDLLQRSLRFNIVLEAATAVTQKAEESTITYLNKGQSYGIQLSDKQASNTMITSTLSIDFHLDSHRMVAENYWKFWISQQKQPDTRTIEIDEHQSTGITDLRFPSFNKITFKWNGRYGAKIIVRFKCLSTDFSRVKGVKGIPLRAQMQSQIGYSSTSYQELCYCRVKLFRDKGAERKNKDDAKQISKQLERVYGKADEASLSLMYNASKPYSVFIDVPTSSEPDIVEDVHTKHHTRIMTAPKSLFGSRQSLSPSSTCQSDDIVSPLSSIETPIQYINSFQDPLTTVIMDDFFSIPFVCQEPSSLYDPNSSFFSQLSPSIYDSSFFSQPSPSIYDVFTPEEIQIDYFSDLSLLQQQLQCHTKNAYDIVSHSDSTVNTKKRSRSLMTGNPIKKQRSFLHCLEYMR